MQKTPFLHTLSVTDGKISFFAHGLGYGRKAIDGPRRHAQGNKTLYFPGTDGTKTVFCIRDRLRRYIKTTRAFFFGARLCRPAFGRCPPQSDRDKCATEKEDGRPRFFFLLRAGVRFFFFSF